METQKQNKIWQNKKDTKKKNTVKRSNQSKTKNKFDIEYMKVKIFLLVSKGTNSFEGLL